MTSAITLSRRNLLTLLSKLDRVKNGEESNCTILKPTREGYVAITAIEDEVAYADRPPGPVHPKDTPIGIISRK